MLSFLPTSVDSTWKINWTRVSSLEKVKWQITNLLNRRWLRRYCRYSPGLNWTQVSHLKWGTSCFLLLLWANFTCLFVRKYWKFNFLTVHFRHSTKLACKLFSQRKAKRQLFSYLKNNLMQQHLCSVFITLLSASPSSGLLWFFCLLETKVTREEGCYKNRAATKKNPEYRPNIDHTALYRPQKFLKKRVFTHFATKVQMFIRAGLYPSSQEIHVKHGACT